MPENRLAGPVLDLVDQGGADPFAAIDQHGVGCRHPHQRGFAGAQRHRQHGLKVIHDIEALRIVDHRLHADVLGETYGHQVAGLFDSEAQRARCASESKSPAT